MKPILLLLSALSLGALACSGDEKPLDDAGVPDSGPMCTTDPDCPVGSHCTNGACVLNTGCSATMPCGDGRMCNTTAGVCVPLGCAGHEVCGTWVCIGPACTEPPACSTGNPCPGDLICNPTTMRCEAPGIVPCTTDMMCTRPQICALGGCVDAIACNYAADCPAGRKCVRDVCDDPCTGPNDCGDQAALWACTAGDCQQRCISDDNCTEGVCDNMLCRPAECTMDNQCGGATRTCLGEEMGHGRCADLIACTPGGGECGRNYECINNACVENPACRTDRDCAGDRYCQDRHCQLAEDCSTMTCPTGFDCVADRCVPGGCRGTCPLPTDVCLGGQCIAEPTPTAVAEVRIISPAPTLSISGTYRFVAIAVDASGNQIAGIRFVWRSATSAVASIDNDGVATAIAAGTSDITAEVDNGTDVIVSAPVTLTVQAAPVNQFRVTVVAESDGAAISGATVVCNAETQTSNASGVALFDATTPKTCSVFTTTHAFVTLVEIGGTESVIRLPTLGASNRSTGQQGQVDFNNVPPTSPVKLSFSGGSFSSPMWSFQPIDLLGGETFTVDVLGFTTIQAPSGATVSATFAGMSRDLKTTYYSLVKPGLHRAWSFAGTAELGDLGIGGGGGGGANLIGNILPLLQTFQHATDPVTRTYIDLPHAVDMNDVDGDGDRTELTPDHAGFVEVPLAPSAGQSMRVALDFGAGGPPAGATALFLVTGAMLPRVGFVPLGLDGQANPTAPLGAISTTLAPPYGGLESGEYAVMAGAQLAAGFSAKMSVTSTLSGTVDFSGAWLVPPVATYTDNTRALAIQAAGQVWRATFRSTEGAWYVYGPSATTTFTLPTPPNPFADRTPNSSVVVEAVELIGGGTVTSLFAPGVDAMGADRATRAFASQSVR